MILLKRLPGLTHVTSLEFCFGNVVQGHFDLNYFYTFENLRDLKVTFTKGRVYPELSSNLTYLSKLERLTVECDYDGQVTLLLDVKWNLMSQLQTVTLHAGALQFGPSVLGFLKLRGLTRVEIDTAMLQGNETMVYFGVLMYSMAIHRPDIALHMIKPWALGPYTPSELLAKFNAFL